MKSIISLISFIVVITFSGCGDHCDCDDKFDPAVTYVNGDMVAYEGKCYEANEQGRGITSGPWQVNGNDIWLECIED